MFYRFRLLYGINTAGNGICIIRIDHAPAQSSPPAPSRRPGPTLPPGPARTPPTGLLFEGDRLEADDEVRPAAVRLPPRPFPASWPLLRVDLQGQGQDGQREAQPASRPALSGRHQTAPQTQGDSGSDGAPVAHCLSPPGEAGRTYRLNLGRPTWRHHRLFSHPRVAARALSRLLSVTCSHRPCSRGRLDEISGLSA